jgi:hypothetical protein
LHTSGGTALAGRDEEGVAALARKGGEGRLELALVACIQDQQAHPESARRILQFFRFNLGKNRVGRIDERSD